MMTDGPVSQWPGDEDVPAPALYQTGPERQESAARGLVPDHTRWVINNLGDVIGDEVLAVSNAAVGLAAIPDQAIGCVIQVQDQAIRWSVLSSRAPTAAIGKRADANNEITLGGIPAMKAFRAIREGASDAALYVMYLD